MTHHKPHSFAIRESELSDDLHDDEIEWDSKSLTPFEEAITDLFGRSFLGQGVALRDGEGTAYRAYDAPIPEDSVSRFQEIVGEYGEYCERPDSLNDLVEKLRLDRIEPE